MKKLLLLLFGLFLTFAINTKVLAENIKFVQIADAHLSVDSEFSEKALKSAIEDINKQQEISFVIFTGDNINNPKQENLRAFLKIVDKLNVPYYLALGNHDVYKSGGLSKAKYFEIVKENNLFFPQRKPNYAFKKNGFLFLIVDGSKEVIPSSVGYYRENTLTWLDKQLTKNEKINVIIMQHFPILSPDGEVGNTKNSNTYKAEEYQNILEKHKNVLAIVSGHLNTNAENMKDGVYHIMSPSILTMPQSYKIIDIVTTKEFSPIIYTQLKEFEVKD